MERNDRSENYYYDPDIEFIECHMCRRHTPKPRARTTTIIQKDNSKTEVLTCRNCNIIANGVFASSLFVARMFCSVTRLLWEKGTRDTERVIKEMKELMAEDVYVNVNEDEEYSE